ncbi:MAG: class I SAM-dependent methyltransferase [Actinobacteria bacterium]|nr:class I SAM-dependent methyltransferase [Actinomycetota bacterium]
MPHVYQRQIDIDSGDSLALIARKITRGSRVLELGAATGYFSRFLKEELGCTVDGIELDAVMAAEAAPFCGKLVVGDLGKERLLDHFKQGAYDFIICADVLEHLYSPEAVLEQLPALLASGGNDGQHGKVIVSIPNIGYAGVILDLIEGGFQYRDEGILDRTHIRFFTRGSFEGILSTVGYEVESVEPVRRALEESEFFGRLDQMPVPLKNYLFARPDADAYQFVFVIRPVGT